MIRQAGLSQLPFAMSDGSFEPAAPQAGIGYQPVPPPPPTSQTMQDVTPTGPSAGIEPPVPPRAALTMQDRAALITNMRAEGYSNVEIMQYLNQIDPQMPTATAEIEEPQEMGVMGLIGAGFREQVIGDSLSGIGVAFERAGYDDMGQAIRSVGEMAALTPEEESARALRAEDNSFAADVGDAVIGSVPAMGQIAAGAGAGAAIGSVVPFIGTAIGAAVGGIAAALPLSIGGARDRAIENGHDVNDPQVQNEILITGAARSVLETIGPSMVMSRVMGPVAQQAVRRTMAAGALRTGGITGVVEGTTEVVGEMLEIAVFDPTVRSQLSKGEVAELLPYVAETYGRDIAIAFAAGNVMGGTMGAAGGAVEQRGINAQLDETAAAEARTAAVRQAQNARQIESLRSAAERGGIEVEALQAAQADPLLAPELARGAQEMEAAQAAVRKARNVLDGVSVIGDQEGIAVAKAKLDAAVASAEEAYDRIIPKIGGLTNAQVKEREGIETERARQRLTSEGLFPAAKAASIPDEEVRLYNRDLAGAEKRVADAEEALRSPDMYEASKRKAATQELEKARDKLRKVRDTIAIRTGAETTVSLKQKARNEEVTRQYEAAVERQYDRKFRGMIDSGDITTAQMEAQRVLAANKANPDKGLQTQITRLEKQLDKATTPDEMDRIEVEIAERKSRLGRRDPLVAAAQRVLSGFPPQQAGVDAQGSSPAAAIQPAAPQATAGSTTAATGAPEPVVAPVATGAPAAAAAPAPAPDGTGVGTTAGTTSGAPAAVPAVAPAKMPATPQEAIKAMRGYGQRKEVSPPEVAKIAAPEIIRDGVQRRMEAGIDPDATPSELWAASKRPDALEFLKLERDIESAYGLPIDATPSAMRAAIAPIEPVPALTPAPAAVTPVAPTPAPAAVTPAVPTPDPEPAAPATRADAAARNDADAETARTQARVDKTFGKQKPVEWKRENREVRGDPSYVDHLDSFARRTTTVVRAQNWVRAKGAETGHEYAVAFDTDTGEVLAAGTNNRPNSVNIADAAMTRLVDGGNVTVVHNHPSGSSLSGQDIGMLYYAPGTMKVVAIAPDGRTFVAAPTAKGREVFKNQNTRAIGSKLADIREAAHNQAERAYLNLGLVSSPLTQADRNAIWTGVSRAVNRAMSQAGLLSYTEGGTPVVLTSRESDAFDLGVKNAREAIRNSITVPAARSARGSGSGSGNAQRPGAVRPRRSRAAGEEAGTVVPDGRARLADDAGRDEPGTGDGRGPRGDGSAGGAVRASESRGRGASRLAGIPANSPGPNPAIVEASRRYLDSIGLPFRRQARYAAVDPARGKRIADAYEAMPHDPFNPEVKAAYDALAKETIAQYEALTSSGLQIEMMSSGMPDPYPMGPRGAILDMLENNHLWVFPTADGYGQAPITAQDIAENPLLAPTSYRDINGRPMVVNDLFRAVHDGFGHGREGVGFGAAGEENTWQSHVRMFTPAAARAMTSETRGQNSWVNFGPYGEANRADQRNTVYAEQKIGLMPEWTMTEGVVDDEGPGGGSGGLSEDGPPRATPESFQAMVEAARARREARDAMVAELVERPGIVRFEASDGMRAAVTKATDGSNDWRTTWIDERGPSGHSNYRTKADAIREALIAGYKPTKAPSTTLEDTGPPPLPESTRPATWQRVQEVEPPPPPASGRLDEDVLTSENYRQKQAEFARLNPDNVAVDATGKPLLLWRGVRPKAEGVTDFSRVMHGIWMSPSREVSASYAYNTQTARFAPGGEMTPQGLLARPEIRDDYNLDVREVGDLLSVQKLIESGAPINSPYWQMVFSKEDSLVSALSREAQQRAIDEGVFTQAQIESARIEPYYAVDEIDPNGDTAPVSVVEPREIMGAADVVARLKKRFPYMTAEMDVGYEGGGVYPLFTNMTNPLVVDWGGEMFNTGPQTGVRVDPIGLDLSERGYYPEYFDISDYGGNLFKARQAAYDWIDAEYAKLEADGVDLSGISFDMEPISTYSTTDEAAVYASEEGYDGLIIRNIIDPGSDRKGARNITDVYVAFEPTQVKHAFDNTGEFDPNDPNILRDDGPPMFDAPRQSVPPLRAAVEQMNANLPAARKLIEVPDWLDVKTEHGSAVKDMLDAARTPKSTMGKMLSYVERNVVNAFTPIRDMELDVQGRLGVGMDSAFKAAEIAINDAGRNETLMFYGAADLNADGAFVAAENTIGIRKMLDKLGKGQSVIDWMDYMGAKRAVEIRAKGFKTPLTDADIARGLAKENPVFKEVAADWKRFNDANVNFLVKTGRITPKLAATLKADAAYVPFYRSGETMDGVPDLYDDAGIEQAAMRGKTVGSQLTSRDPGIKKLKGDTDLKVNNIINNMIRNSQAMVAAGMRNRAANLTFDMMLDAGYVRSEKATRRGKNGNIVGKAMPENAVRMWKNGKESYIVPETADAIPLMIALGGLAPVRLTGIAKFMADVGSFFRQSITLSPAFIVRNMVRDVVSTGVLMGGRNLTFRNNALTGFRAALKSGASRQAFTAMSGMGDFRFGGGDIGLGRNDLMIELGILPKTLGSRFRKVIGTLEELGTASELANRIAVYNSMVESGTRPDEAAYQALTLVNYGRRGASSILRTMLPMIPFLNARIQGLARMGEDFTSKRGTDRTKALTQLALNGAVLSMASAALWAWNMSDEERRRKYEAEPLHRRLNYHIAYLGDFKLMIPKAFEIGTVFATAPEMLMEAAIAGNTEELGAAGVMTLMNTFAFNPIPAAMLPAFEVVADYSFFTGRAIEGPRLANLMREDRLTPSTSALAVGLSRSFVGDFTGLSPVAIDHLLAGYGGVAYTSLASTIDVVAGDLGIIPARPEGVFGSIPIVSPALQNTFGSMFKSADGDAANRFVDDFYTNRAAITQVYRSARTAALSGDVERARELLAQAPMTPEVYTIVNRAGTRLTEINDAMRRLRNNSDMSAAEKRAPMTELVNERNRIAYEVNEIIKRAEEAQGTSFRRAAR